MSTSSTKKKGKAPSSTHNLKKLTEVPVISDVVHDNGQKSMLVGGCPHI